MTFSEPDVRELTGVLTVVEEMPPSSVAEISVVIATHSVDRLAMLTRTIDSVMSSPAAPAEVIVAVDHNPDLVSRLTEARDDVRIVAHTGSPGASGTRNAGAAEARGDILVFTDDDVTVRPDWLVALTAPFRDPHVAGTGGRTLPAWDGARPGWFPEEFGWVIGVSHAGLPDTQCAVRNVWSENMAIRREAFDLVGGFRHDFGKIGTISRPEDTDLCIRVGTALPDSGWLYVPTAIVDHVVPRDRGTLAFFVRRCFWEGAGKVELALHLDRYRDLGDERAYLTRVVPSAFIRDVRRGHLARAVTLLVGVLAAGAGAATSLVRSRGPLAR